MLIYKILWTLLSIFVYCFGCEIICPFIDTSLLKSNSIFLNSFLRSLAELSGGKFDNASLFALGISPYISASIFVSSLFRTNDYLMNKKKYEDPNIITRYTKFASLPIAIGQGCLFVHNIFKAASANPNIIVGVNIANWHNKLLLGSLLVIVLVANTMFLTWLSDFVTENGIGQGSSVIIATGIFYNAVRDFKALTAQKGYHIALVVFIVLIAIICFVEGSYRKLPLTYYRGREKMGKRYNINTYLPIKFNPAGILPVIFATQFSLFFRKIFSMIKAKIPYLGSLLLKIPLHVENKTAQLGPIIVSLMLLGFSYMYLDVFGSPEDLSKNIQTNTGVIQGKRPGKQTQRYIESVSRKIALFGCLYLAFVYHFTSMSAKLLKISFFGIFNSSSAMICVVISLEVISQIVASAMSALYSQKRTTGSNIL